MLFFHLGAEVEGHYGGDDDHHIIGGDGSPHGQGSEHHQHHEGDDGLDLDQVGQVFNKVFHIFSFQLDGFPFPIFVEGCFYGNTDIILVAPVYHINTNWQT